MKLLAIIANLHKPGARLAVEQIRAWAKQYDIGIVTNLEGTQGEQSLAAQGTFGLVEDEVLRQRFQGADLAITLGGDGTLLYGVRVVAPLQVPVLSINLGNVGFHTQAEPQELSSCLEAMREGEYRIERRFLLETVIEPPSDDCPPPVPGACEASGSAPPPEKARCLALNDIVISKSSWGHMVHLRLHIDGKPLTDVDADSLVVATPTGSSAYNYAADGPVVVPWMDAIVMNTICAHRMNLSPLVVSPESTIAVRACHRSPLEEAQILIDGQPWNTLSPNACLKISRAPLYLPLVIFRDDFYEKLRDRLGWGGLN